MAQFKHIEKTVEVHNPSSMYQSQSQMESADLGKASQPIKLASTDAIFQIGKIQANPKKSAIN